MKVSKEQAEENRKRILGEAARLFRERGLSGIGVDALMKAAGLTHGSLYSQFGSKERLMAEAIVCGHAASVERAPANIDRDMAIDMYLSAQHRDNPGMGCFMAALGCDVAHQSEEVRQGFTKVVQTNVARFPAAEDQEGEELSIATIATMVGAMILARAVDDQEFSDQILEAAKAELKRKK